MAAYRKKRRTGMSVSQVIALVFHIDLATQTVFPLAELPKHTPKRRGGKALNVATAFRWAKDGARAKDGTLVRLPIIQVAGTKCTSIEAFQWFCERLTAGGDSTFASPRSTATRRREIEKADREVRKMGV
jgi:hypothetical protein